MHQYSSPPMDQRFGSWAVSAVSAALLTSSLSPAKSRKPSPMPPFKRSGTSSAARDRCGAVKKVKSQQQRTCGPASVSRFPSGQHSSSAPTALTSSSGGRRDHATVARRERRGGETRARLLDAHASALNHSGRGGIPYGAILG